MSGLTSILSRTIKPGSGVRPLVAFIPSGERLKGILLVNALVVAFAGFSVSSWLALSAWNDNRTIARLTAGHELATVSGERPEILLARAHSLIRQRRLDEAQALVPAAEATADRRVIAALQYDLANARVRTALRLIEETKIDPAIALINLAKGGYRAALSIRPESWDARYNLDVAMRLVRDFPEVEQSSDEPPLETSERLWTDLPGLPRGLP